MMDLIAAHRLALADALDQLTDEQWHGESLCAGWTPAHVLAHQTMPFRIPEDEFMTGMQRCRGDFTRLSNEIAERDSHLPPAELVAILRDNAETPWSPPGGGLTGSLSHAVIHGIDVGWPLGLAYEIPDRAMTLVLDSITTPLDLGPHAVRGEEVRPDAGPTTIFGFPLAGIRATATDLGWSAGDGAELAGSSRDLLPLLAGRRIPRDRFSGDGAARAWSLAGR